MWLNRASVFSVPSITVESGASEGFGLVFAEAQSMGVPVASFATGGIPEAVENGRTGLLCRERDVDSLAANIGRLLTNRSMWQKFSAAAEAHVRNRFNLQTQTSLLEDWYEEVVAESLHRSDRNQLQQLRA